MDSTGLTSGPTETRYYYGGKGFQQVIEEQDELGATQATYVYGMYIDDTVQMRRGGQDYYYHCDDLYNTMAVTDSLGNVVERYEYGDYGQVEFRDASGTALSTQASAIGNPYLFTGRRFDEETGLYWYRTRYYDSSAGRFASRDSIGIWGEPLELGNGLAYVGNNPWTHTDPLGLGIGDWLFTGDWNAWGGGEDVYDAGVDGAGQNLLDTSPVRGGYVGGSVPVIGNSDTTGSSGVGVVWTMDDGGSAYIGGGVTVTESNNGQEKGGGAAGGWSYSFDDDSVTPYGSAGFGGGDGTSGVTGTVSTSGTFKLGINYGPINAGLVLDPSRLPWPIGNGGGGGGGAGGGNGGGGAGGGRGKKNQSPDCTNFGKTRAWM